MKDLPVGLLTDGLLTRDDWDGTFFACPDCGKDVRIDKNYTGDPIIMNRILHIYPCKWYEAERYRIFNS